MYDRGARKNIDGIWNTHELVVRALPRECSILRWADAKK